MEKSANNPLDDKGPANNKTIEDVKDDAGNKEEVFIADECGDSLWEEVLVEQEKKIGLADEHKSKNPGESDTKNSRPSK